jgi:hypothetical protein
MAPPLTFWIDSYSNRLAANWNSFVFAGRPEFRQGDAVPVLLRWIQRPALSTSFMEEIPFGNYDIMFEVGNIGWRPSGGQWYLNNEDYSTDLIEWNAEASDVEVKLNSILPIVQSGGVRVTRSNDDGYKIIFVENGVREPITGFGEGLVPTCNVVVSTVTLGSESTKAVFWVTLRQIIVSEEVGNWTTEAACTAAVSQLKPDIWDVYLTSQPQDGNFSISVDAGSPITISVLETPASFQTKLGAGFVVTKQGDYTWRIRSDDGSAFTVTIEDDANIVSFVGKENTILLNDQLVSEMLSGLSMTSSMLEISILADGNKQTILSIPCTVVGKVTG